MAKETPKPGKNKILLELTFPEGAIPRMEGNTLMVEVPAYPTILTSPAIWIRTFTKKESLPADGRGYRVSCSGKLKPI